MTDVTRAGCLRPVLRASWLRSCWPRRTRQLVELMHLIAGENMAGRFNHALGVGAASLTRSDWPLEQRILGSRTGPPVDDEEDYALDVWAGVVPLSLQAGAPLPDERLSDRIRPPAYAANYHR